MKPAREIWRSLTLLALVRWIAFAIVSLGGAAFLPAGVRSLRHDALLAICGAALSLALTCGLERRFAPVVRGLGGLAAGSAILAGGLLGRMSLAGFDAAQAGYVMLAGAAAILAIRLLAGGGRAADPGREWAEEFRLVTLALLAAGLFRGYLTPDFFGGNDARWYGYAMSDAVQQSRAGVFPILVGQSEFMFDGAINPIRLAPYYQHLGAVLDKLTLQALPPIAIQHLAVVTTAMLAAINCYLCLAALAPARRWLAHGLAALYLLAPVGIATLSLQEMYLTFMAVAWLPVVVYGNLRLVRADDFVGWIWLTAGLALVWMAHAPIGAWTTLATGLIQGFRLLGPDWKASSWLRAAGGGLLFAGLAGFYFYSFSELSTSGSSDAPGEFLPGLALAAGFAALIRFLESRLWRWLLAPVAVAIPLWFQSPAHAWWLTAATVLSAAVGAAGARWSALRPRNGAPEWFCAVALAGGLLVLPLTRSAEAAPALEWVQQQFPDSLLPVHGNSRALSEVQIGWSLWLILLAGLIGRYLRPTRESRALTPLVLVLLGLVLPLPGVTRLLLATVPVALYRISSVILWTRCLPLLAAVAVFFGHTALAGLRREAVWRKAGLVAALVAMFAWSAWEADKFVRRRVVINTPEEVRAFYRPETIRQFSYVLRNMPMSSYMINGVVDYHLESRLLSRADPAQELDDRLPWNQAKDVALVSRPESAPPWLQLDPGLTLAPGDRLALKFEFLARPYAGTLVSRGPGGFYREYALPESGFFAKGFGVAPGHPKILAFWNTLAVPQPVEFAFLQAEAPTGAPASADFARVKMLPYSPGTLPIRTTSLIPYRAETTSDQPAFLETPRLFLPGYAVTVNGRKVTPLASPNHRVMVPLEPGSSRVEVRYAGTPRLWLAFALSALAWAGAILVLARASARPARAGGPEEACDGRGLPKTPEIVSAPGAS